LASAQLIAGVVISCGPVRHRSGRQRVIISAFVTWRIIRGLGWQLLCGAPAALLSGCQTLARQRGCSRKFHGEAAQAWLRRAHWRHANFMPTAADSVPVYERAAYSGAQPDEDDLRVAADALSRARDLAQREHQGRKRAR
jgi:hypothetical protein